MDDKLVDKLKSGKTATLGVFQTPEQGRRRPGAAGRLQGSLRAIAIMRLKHAAFHPKRLERSMMRYPLSDFAAVFIARACSAAVGAMDTLQNLVPHHDVSDEQLNQGGNPAQIRRHARRRPCEKPARWPSPPTDIRLPADRSFRTAAPALRVGGRGQAFGALPVQHRHSSRGSAIRPDRPGRRSRSASQGSWSSDRPARPGTLQRAAAHHDHRARPTRSRSISKTLQRQATPTRAGRRISGRDRSDRRSDADASARRTSTRSASASRASRRPQKAAKPRRRRRN